MSQKSLDDLISISSDFKSSFTEIPKGVYYSQTFDPGCFISSSFKKPEPPDFDKIKSPLKKKSNNGRSPLLVDDESGDIKEEKQRKKRSRKKEINPVNFIKDSVIEVIVDNNLIGCSYGGEILSSVVQVGSLHIVKSQHVPYSITWNRKITNKDHSVVSEEEDSVLIMWDADYFLTQIEDDNLQANIQSVQDVLVDKRLTLAILNLETYFNEISKDENRKFKSRVSNELQRKRRKLYSNFNISRIQIEELLVELQILNDCSTWIVNTVEDVKNLIFHLTKAVKEKPFKIEKQKQEVEGLGWLVSCDLKDSVRVDKSGNGLLQLWQKQLMQFNNSGLDIAQAIVQQYPTPSALYKAYCLCENSKKGEELLKDILIRRGFGESAVMRRIGPELSKKLYYFYTSLDGNLPLSQE